MSLVTCTRCGEKFDDQSRTCPGCGTPSKLFDSDSNLKREATRVCEERSQLKLAGLTGGLEFVIINTEPKMQRSAVAELLTMTGFECCGAHEDDDSRDYVLTAPGSADIVVRSRKRSENPFAAVNRHPISMKLPNTRLETLVFRANDLEKYVEIQKSLGVKFLTSDIVRTDNFKFIQTPPSRFTGNSVGFVEWKGSARVYAGRGSVAVSDIPAKPERPYLLNIKRLDHIATRLTARDRDPAIIEFMQLTDYNFDMAIYVEQLNSITNVARLSTNDFAMVFTSGIHRDSGSDGPTEKFVANYGARVHHMAFHTERIEETYESLKSDGVRYLIELVGSPDEGLKQTFTLPSEQTMLVTEYIRRYGSFDGFFSKKNVTLLTAASDYTPND